MGSRSFSLYLIHEPSVVSVAELGRTSDAIVVLAVRLPLALLVAEMFWRSVQRPSQRLAKHIGARLAGRRVGGDL